MSTPGDDHTEFLDSEFAKRFMSDEPLNPELVPYYDKETDSIRHPLVYSLYGTRPGQANYLLEQKKKAIAKAIAKKDWHSYVFLHERPYRAEALVEILHGPDGEGGSAANDFTVKQLAQLAASVWTDSENIWQNNAEWAQIWGAMRSYTIPSGDFRISGWVRQFMLNEEDQKTFEAMPEEIAIFRGVTRGLNDFGWSWTTDHDQAVWFARRWAIHGDREQGPAVVHGRVAKRHVLAYFDADHRGEKEIVADPDDVTFDRWEKV